LIVCGISTTHLLIQSQEPLQVDEEVGIDLAVTGTCQIEVVWISGDYYGCRFLRPIPSAAVRAERLMFSPWPAACATPDGTLRVSDFGPQLREFRTARNWNIEKMAKWLGVSRQAVWFWETGQRTPGPGHLKKLADLFKLSGAQLPPPPKEEPRHETAMDMLKREMARLRGPSGEKSTVVVEF
jgi:transcriptional regulator with XRE-family HTH domain